MRTIPSVLADALAATGLQLGQVYDEDHVVTATLRDTYPPEQRTTVKKTQSRGDGLFATVDVKAHCPVFAENCTVALPWYVVLGRDAMRKFSPPDGFPQALQGASDWRLLADMLLNGYEQLLRDHFRKLRAPRAECEGAEAFAKWWNAHPKRREYGDQALRVKNVEVLFSKVQANLFALGVESIGYYYAIALAPTVARVNHSCRPNCMLVAIHDTVALVALRDIGVDEELVRTYSSFVGESYQGEWDVCVRNAVALSQTFKCACAVCSSGPTGSCRGRENLISLEELNSKIDDMKLDEAMEYVEQQWESLAMRLDPPSDLPGAEWGEDEKRMKLTTVARYLHMVYQNATQQISKRESYADALVMHADSLKHINAIDEHCRPELRLVETELVMLRFIEYLVVEKDATGGFEERFLCVCIAEFGIVEAVAMVRAMAFLAPDFAIGLNTTLQLYDEPLATEHDLS